MSGSRRSSTTQSHGWFAQRRQRIGAGVGGEDLDVVVAEQFGDAHLLGGVVLHDQQALAPGFGVFLDLRQRRADALGRRRLVDEGERAARQRMLTVFVERDDLHRNVPRQRIVLELAQHGPAQHVRQEHVERNRRRLELLGEFERLGAAAGDQHLEALVAGQIDQHPRIMRIVLDDQEDGISRLEVEAVVRQLLDDPLLRRCGLQRRRRREGRRGRGPVAQPWDRNISAADKARRCCPCRARCADGFRRRAGSRVRG